jgi:hypothetical protein
MYRFVFYCAIAFLLWQVARSLLRTSSNRTARRRQQKAEPLSVPRRSPATPMPKGSIDYSKVRDADYRDIR